MNLIRKVVRKFQAHLKMMFSIPKEKKYNIISVKPHYKIVDKLNDHSIVVDLGTGRDADFSQNLIRRYGLKAYGFDPTKKNHPNLDSIVKKTKGLFKYYKYAISDTNGTKTFFESLENISGSFFNDHINVKRDAIRSYDVQTIRLDTIFDILNINHIDLLKMDIEGEEYSVLSSVSDATLKRIDQIAVEFHHHCIDHFSVADTRNIIQILENAGFISHTTDYINYLFFRNTINRKTLKADKNSLKVLYLTDPGGFTYKKTKLIRCGLKKKSFFDSAMASMEKYSIKVDYMARKSWGVLNEVVQALKALIFLDNYDVVLTKKGAGVFLALMRFFLRWKKPYLLVVMWRVGSNSMLAPFIKRIIRTYVDKIICVSSVQKRIFARQLKVPENRIEYVPLGIDTNFFKPEINPVDDFILCVGDADRDDETLVKAFMNLPIKLIRVSDESKVLERVGALIEAGLKHSNLKEKFVLLHGVSDLQLKKLYAKSRIVVVPIRRHSDQPAGLTALLEAMAMGKDVVVTKGLATEDYVINGETGIVINPGDADQLKSAILELLDDDLKCKKLGSNARRSVEEKFALKRSTKKLANLLQSIINES